MITNIGISEKKLHEFGFRNIWDYYLGHAIIDNTTYGPTGFK